MAPAVFPTLARQAHTLLSRALSSDLGARTPGSAAGGGSSLGPLAARAVLLARDGDNNQVDPTKGVISPHDINNNALFALFGIIGAAFVCVGIWFFFWARNGGFYFKKNDWDDYKTTVLRRRGPNGTLLSGATPSTQLGGGSVYKDVDDGSTEDATTTVSGMTGVTGSTGLTGITAGVSDIDSREKRRKKREQKEREKERRREEKSLEKEHRKRDKSGNRKVGKDGVLIDEEAEALAKAQLRSYRHEKPARVGGLNREGDGSHWDGSTNPSQSTTAGTESTVTSELINNRERTPTSTPTKKERERASGGIRKVYSTADKTADRESERIRAEARKLQEKGRAAQRRDFSWRQGDEGQRLEDTSNSSRADERETHVPGSWQGSDVGSEVGTKSYHHVIPGISSNASTSDYAEEKRRKRGGAGYRRNRHDTISEDGH